MGHETGEAGRRGQQAAQPVRRRRAVGTRRKQQALRQEQQRQDADDARHHRRAQVAEQHGANHRAQQRPRNQALEQRPVHMAAEGVDAHQVHHQQQRHQDGRCLGHAHAHRHQRHGQRAEARAETALADAKQQHGGNGKGVEMPVGDQGKGHRTQPLTGPGKPRRKPGAGCAGRSCWSRYGPGSAGSWPGSVHPGRTRGSHRRHRSRSSDRNPAPAHALPA